MKHNKNISIFRGGAIGTIMGYAIALHLGIAAGVMIGFITAFITSDLLSFILAGKSTKKEITLVGKAFGTEFEKYVEHLGVTNQLQNTKNALLFLLTVVSFIPAYLVWKPFVPYTAMKELGDIGAIIIIIASLVANFAMLICVWLLFTHNGIFWSGNLSWPISKRIKGGYEKAFNCISDAVIIGKTLKPFDWIFHQIERSKHDNRKENEYNLVMTGYLCGIFILLNLVLAVAPSRWVMRPLLVFLGICFLITVIDVILMILLRCATTTTTSAACGAALAIISEWWIYPTFDGHVLASWMYFGAFAIGGGLFGMAIYNLRERLLRPERKIVAVQT